MVLSVIVGYVILAPLFWIAIVWLISRMSGWARLARQYPATGPVAGHVFRWCSAQLRMFSRYSFSLVVTVSESGIHLQPIVFFKFGHDPIFLPWESIDRLERQRSPLFPSVKLWVEDQEDESPVTIVLYGRRLVESLEQHFRA